MTSKLTNLQAFNTMRKFLEYHFNMTSSDDLGALLSCMQFLPDNITVDPALGKHWAIVTNNKKTITTLEAFNAMQKFLAGYYKNSSSEEVKKLLESMQLKDDTSINPMIWDMWMSSVNEVLSEPVDARHYLTFIKE
jgi:hypothetical protein